MTSRYSYPRAATLLLSIAVASVATAQTTPRIPTSLTSPTTLAPTLEQAQQSRQQQAAVFIENKGQWDRQAKFLLKSGGLDVWISDHGVRYDLFRLDDVNEPKNSDRTLSASTRTDEPKSMTRTGHVVDVSFEGASFTTVVRGTDVQPGYYNYFLGNDESKWATNVRRFGGARIDGLYKGIDAVFYLDEGRPRYDLVVAPGADPAQVRMRIEGSQKVSVGADGSLLIATTMGVLEQRELYAYQRINGAQRQVACRFVVGSDQRVQFDIGEYDRSQPLIVDPLIYSTYLGGAGDDWGIGIAVDGSGNAYITGITYSSSPSNRFPTTRGAYNETHSGSREYPDVFVTKLNSNGSALLYSTFLGGADLNFHYGIAIDGSGNVYATGSTRSSTYPTTTDAYDESHNGSSDAFVTKLNSSGSALLYSTVIGGGHDDRGTGIMIDGSGNVYVTGYTKSSNFPTLGQFQNAQGGNDVFLLKLSLGVDAGLPTEHSTPHNETLLLNALTPNPTASDLHVSYSLSEAMVVSMEIYTSDGRTVATPLSGESHAAGSHSRSIDVSGLTSGVCSLRLVAGTNARVQRFVVVR